MLYQGALKFGGLMLLRSKLFNCLRLPIYSMLERGEPNPMLGSIKARRVSAASQQTFFIVSGSPSNIMLGVTVLRHTE